MDQNIISDLELLLGHHFRDESFIENALSHSSVKTERRPSNERLEFLGDSVLGLVVAEALYRQFPDDEGTLTRIKGQAVSRATLQRIAQAMGLDRYISVGKGVAKREIPASLLGNLFEAIIGAIYLDAGLAAARKFIMRHLDVVIEEIVEDRAERNYKSMLQHYCQRDLGSVPTYRVIRESGPAHGRAFEVAMSCGGKEYGRAKADSKKEAEQGAARAALIHFRQVDERPSDVTTRGAGTLLRVGTQAPAKRSRRRKPQRSAPNESAGHTPEPEKESSRRRRGSRGGRRRRGGRGRAKEPQGANDTAPEPGAPRAPAPPRDVKPAEKRPRRKRAKKKVAGSVPKKAAKKVATTKRTVTQKTARKSTAKKTTTRRKKKTGGE